MEQHSTGERTAVRMCVGICVVMSECIEMCDVNTAVEENEKLNYVLLFRVLSNSI